METLRQKLLIFLNRGSGYGCGCGYGSGSGSGSGCGYGPGDGSGSGYGDGCGYGDGDGSGYGDGCGYGYGDGYGSGCGCGYGDGDGCGDGSGCGDGYGDGIKSFNGDPVWNVDEVQTIIHEVHGNIAKGFILKSDLSLEACFIAKHGNCFAHGETLHEAYESLQSKLFENYPEEVRLRKFKETYPDFNRKIPAKELFEWHNRLTGSCLMGRRSFVSDRGIDIETASYTVKEFISVTENSYGGHTIRKLLDMY